MMRFIADNEAFIQNSEGNKQNGREKEKEEFWHPSFDIPPPVLGIIILEINKQPDESKPNDIVLSDEKTQDAEHTGKPKPLVERGPKSQENIKHRINVRIDQKEEWKK